MNFVSIVSRMSIPTSTDFDDRACPDQYIGCLSRIESEGQIPSSVRLPTTCRPDRPSVILVLESPHREEFKDGRPGPARGKTGKNIAQYLRDVLGRWVDEDPPLILMNAIQYQCSLGHCPRCFRDRVFREMWKQGGKECFVQRLRSTFLPGDRLVCCCTKGNTQGVELRQLVYCAMRSAVPETAIHRRTHPASWGYGQKNRQSEWSAPQGC